MPLYNGPEQGFTYYQEKFIRMKSRIFVTARSKENIDHCSLAFRDIIYDEIARFKAESLSELTLAFLWF